MLLSAQSQIGYAIESEPNAYAKPTLWVPFSSLTANDQISTFSIYGDLNPSEIVSLASRAGSVDIQHFATPDVVLAELRSMFGNEATNGNTHTFTVSSMPPTTSITEYDGQTLRAYLGAILATYTLSWQDSGVLACQAKWSAQVSQEVSAAISSVPIVEPPLGWQGTISISGQQVGRITGGQWQFQRTLVPWYVDGSADPICQVTAAFKATAQLTMVVSDEGALDDLRQTSTASVATTFGSIAVSCSSAAWTSLGRQRGSNELKETLSIEANFNPTDQGACTVTVSD